MEKLLNTISQTPLRVVDTSISLEAYIPISLSSKNKELIFDVSSSKEWEMYLKEFLEKNGKKVAYGGYLEERDIYNRSAHFAKLKEKDQRNIHLGIDLWCNENTKVLAVLDGEVHSFNNNTNFGDYGPTIILKHTIENLDFYSLYGHLSLDSIEGIKVGTVVKQEEVIGKLGSSKVNGDYAPHLHFQIILDMEESFGDYPGVCTKKDIKFYQQNCPNPNVFLKLPNEI